MSDIHGLREVEIDENINQGDVYQVEDKLVEVPAQWVGQSQKTVKVYRLTRNINMCKDSVVRVKINNK